MGQRGDGDGGEGGGKGGERCLVSATQWGIPSKGWDLGRPELWVRVTFARARARARRGEIEREREKGEKGGLNVILVSKGTGI